MTSYGERRWGKPPPGYVAGIARGDFGFSTKSEGKPGKILKNNINIDKCDKEKKSNSMINNISILREQNKDNEEDYKEEQEILLHSKQIENYMGERRGKTKEKSQKYLNKKREKENDTSIKNQFSLLKNELKRLDISEWENIPVIKEVLFNISS